MTSRLTVEQVIIEALDADRRFRLYLAPLDRRSQPRQIANVEGRQPRFGPDGSIFFRASGFAYRVDGRRNRPPKSD